MSTKDKNEVTEAHKLAILAGIVVHNVRAECILEKNEEIPALSEDVKWSVDMISKVRISFEQEGLVAGLKKLKKLGDYTSKINDFSQMCRKQAEDLLSDVKRQAFAKIGYEIWTDVYRQAFWSIGGLSVTAMDAVACSLASIAVYDGYYAYVVNAMFADHGEGVPECTAFEVSSASKAVTTISNYQKEEFQRILRKITV